MIPMSPCVSFPFMPPDLSVHGAAIDMLIVWVHILMAVLFVGWGTFFVWTLVRFRHKRNPKADYGGVKSHASTYLEVAVAVIEGVLLVGLAIPLCRPAHALPERRRRGTRPGCRGRVPGRGSLSTIES